MKCAAKDRGRLDSAFRDVVGGSGSVRHFILTVEVKIMDIDRTAEAQEDEETVRSCLHEEQTSEVKASITKRPFRGKRKAYIGLEEARALMLLKVTHIKRGWVSCRVRRKTEINRYYRCLGFGHIVTDCQGPDRSKSCCRCGYLCIARQDKPSRL